ncbi:MAG: formate dehydrogenase subunit gamma [Armatimonadota bacterium]
MDDKLKSTSERYFERLTLNQRIQHMVLIVSFTMLVLTGLPVRYPDTLPSYIVIHLVGGFATRSLLHRIAAVMLMGLVGYHVGFTILTPRGRSEFKALLPNVKDLFDSIRMMLFYLGFSSKQAKFDRYNFIEKFEYLAVGWGSVVMIITGLLLWFEVEAMMYLPKWILDVARVIHSYEGLLAFLAIIIWHFYHVHLNPEVFPMSKIWLNGKISEHDMKEHHPLEYERIIEEERMKNLAANSVDIPSPEDSSEDGTTQGGNE